MQARTLTTFAKVKAPLLVVAVHGKPRRSETLSDTLTVVKAEALVDARADTLEEPALTQIKTLGYMEAKTLVYALADTLRKKKGKTEEERLGGTEAIKLVQWLTNTLRNEV